MELSDQMVFHTIILFDMLFLMCTALAFIARSMTVEKKCDNISGAYKICMVFCALFNTNTCHQSYYFRPMYSTTHTSRYKHLNLHSSPTISSYIILTKPFQSLTVTMDTYLCLLYIIEERVSDCCCMPPHHFQLYHRENELMYNEIMMRSVLYYTSTLS